MVKKDNYSTIVSFGLHILLFIVLIVFTKPVEVLMPSRSDGITVALVSSSTPTPISVPKAVVNNQPDPVKTLDTPADVNMEDKKAQPPKKPEEKIEPVAKPQPEQAKPTPVPPPPKPDKPEPKPTPPKDVPKTNIKADINDLLGDVTTTNTKGVRKGQALGGNPNGTSDSDNLVGNYADLVIKTVRPFVQIPENVNPKAKAIVKIELYPNLQVKSATLIKSSGNHQYDENVQNAIKRVKVFPPLPDGAKFVNYRILNLTFIPY